MTFIALLSSRSVGAFSSLARRSFVSTTARYMAGPVDEDKMPFYALGTNLALQVGGQGNFKTLLEEDELDIVLEAFCEKVEPALRRCNSISFKEATNGIRTHDLPLTERVLYQLSYSG